MFRNLKNVISASNFTKLNNYLLRHPNQTLNPTN